MKSSNHMVHEVHIASLKTMHFKKPYKTKVSRGECMKCTLVHQRKTTGLEVSARVHSPIYRGMHNAPTNNDGAPTPIKESIKQKTNSG